MPQRILVVDDEAGLTDVLRDLLELEGYEVAVCHEMSAAKEKLAESKFDAAMLDVFLTSEPVGLDLARWIMAEYPDTSVILMTGYADKTDVESACLSGAYTCLAKPFDLDDVVRVVGIALESRFAA